MKIRLIATLALATALAGLSAAPAAAQSGTTHRHEGGEFLDFSPQPDHLKRRYTFATYHDAAWAWDALEELTGSRPPEGASPDELARLIQQQLDRLPSYGERETAVLRPPIAQWFLDGYRRYQPGTVPGSRFLNQVNAGTLSPAPQVQADVAALYAYWSLYTAEWFSLSRHPGFKAWLSAVALEFPPRWIVLKDESRTQLHNRLVAPLQTPDEPWREIDNWIRNFTAPVSSGSLGAFVKPRVRDALVEELLARAGMEADPRYFERSAYGSPAPGNLGLSDREFFLLAALTLEFFQEVYAASPNTRGPLHFRDYFVESFQSRTR